jgi:hypothetical protein
MSKFICERLAKHHNRMAFDCGVPDLDVYLRQRASLDMRRHVAAVFVMVPEDEPNRIAGYYSLSSASILLDELPNDLVKKLPRYPNMPAVLIGRLARDISFSGVGRLLLIDALARSLRHTDDVASAVVLVDVKNDSARAFCLRHGFANLSDLPNRMFLPMTTVETFCKTDPNIR